MKDGRNCLHRKKEEKSAQDVEMFQKELIAGYSIRIHWGIETFLAKGH